MLCQKWLFLTSNQLKTFKFELIQQINKMTNIESNLQQCISIKFKDFTLQTYLQKKTMSDPRHFQFNKKKIRIIVKFKACNFQQQGVISLSYGEMLTVQKIQNAVNKIQKQKTSRVIDNKPVLKFVKQGFKFIPFQKLAYEPYKNILLAQQIQVEYLFKNKRDQLRKHIVAFQNEVQQRHSYLMDINNSDYGGSKMHLLKKIASKKSGLPSNATLEVKIKIVLFISDPLVRSHDKSIPVWHEEIDCEQHLKLLKQASNSYKSLEITVDKYYAIQRNIMFVFPDMNLTYSDNKKSLKIVHFFTSIVRKNGQLYIVFEQKKSNLGEEKLIKAMDFLSRIKQSNISLLIFIGYNVNLLRELLVSSFPIPILLLSTYNPNNEEPFMFFLKTFYENLFNRNEIQSSIEIAKQEHKKKFIDPQATLKKFLLCCCFHEHSQHCAWTKIVEKTGIRLAHKIFFHKNLKSNNAKEHIPRLQKALISEIANQTEVKKCAAGQYICCLQQSHLTKLRVSQKIMFFPSPSQKNLVFTIHQIKEFVKNEFKTEIIPQKIHQSKRCPLIINEVVKKILININKCIQFRGSKRIGKSQFIQSACRYIKQRKTDFQFQNIDLNEGSLQQSIKYMYKKAEKHKKDKKQLVFIHHNSAMIFQKQFFRIFKQNVSSLPFTLLIKINEQEEEEHNRIPILINVPLQSHINVITLPKLKKVDILCEAFQELKEEFFEDQRNIFSLFSFSKHFDSKLTYKNTRSFLKYFNEKLSHSWSGKSLQDIYKDMSIQFSQKIESLQKNNKNLFAFLGFISQFPQGIYLTKLNIVLLNEVFGIEDVNGIVNTKQNVNFYFEVIAKTYSIQSTNLKKQKVYIVLPDDKIIHYFQQNKELSIHFQLMKHKFFYYLFNLLQRMIIENSLVMSKRLKKEKVFLDEGIFMFNINKKKRKLNEEDKIIKKIGKSLECIYATQADIKITFENQSKQKIPSAINERLMKEKLLKQKILSIILHETQKYILFRHLSNIASIMLKGIKISERVQSIDQKQQQNNQCKFAKYIQNNCPIIFYKKILFVYKILIKETQKFQQIETKIRNIESNLVRFYQQRGSRLLSFLISQQQKSDSKRGLKSKQHRSFHFTPNQQKSKQQQIKKFVDSDSFNINEVVQHDAEKYFQKLVGYLQIHVLLNRKDAFSLNFNDYGGRRKNLNQTNIQKFKSEKEFYRKTIQQLLPLIKKQTKSQQTISHSQEHSRQTNSWFNDKNLCYRNLTCEQLIILFLHKILLYECQEQFINYFSDFERMINSIDKEIRLFESLLQIERELLLKNVNNDLFLPNEEKKYKYQFFTHIHRQELIVQILKLNMRKIQIHFKQRSQSVKNFQGKNAQSSIKRLIDLKEKVFDQLQKYCSELKQSLNNPKSKYFQDQKLETILKNAYICQKYIDLIREHDKVTEEFTTSIGQVDSDYKEMFSYLCQQAWKKMLFNETNNIIFFKSRVIVFKNKPHTYVRKRNITMKYVKKMLNDLKINITFLHLTRNNFNYIQIDKRQNPNCKIKYLVLTVDCYEQNNQIYLIFEQHHNIMDDLVKLDTFLQMMANVNVQFIIIMGQKAKILAQNMSKQLKNSTPIILALENNQLGLANFVPYVDPIVIDQQDEFLSNSPTMFNQFQGLSRKSSSSFINNIYEYLDIECFHTLMEMILCTLVTNMVQVYQQNYRSSSPTHSSHFTNEKMVVCSYKKIADIVNKSIDMAKQIIRAKWQKAKQIDVKFQIYPYKLYELQSSVTLRRNFSTVLQPPQQLSFSARLSSRQSRDTSQFIRYFPYFQRGIITDNTIKLYDLPPNLPDEQYYENVNRIQELYWIMSFIQTQGRRMVEIFGSKRSGKSSFLRQICWINQTYRLFKDGVYIFDAQTLYESSQTLLWHIQIFYKEHKLFTILEQDYCVQKNHPSTILLGLDSLDTNSLHDNHEFFQRLKGKPICLIYSTASQNIAKQINNYLQLQIVNENSFKKKNFDTNQSISTSTLHLFSNRSHHLNHHSLSHEILQKRKSDEMSEKDSVSEIHQQVWHLMRININPVSKHALFNIALSYLKKQQIAKQNLGLKQFIQKHFSVFLATIFKEMTECEIKCLPKTLSNFQEKRISETGPMSEQLICNQQLHEQEQSQKSNFLQKTKSQITQLSWSSQKSSQTNKSFLKQSLIEKLLTNLQSYLAELTQDKIISLSTSSIQTKDASIGNTGKNLLGKIKDSRLWFYEDCFEQLMVMNNTYDKMQIAFR